MLAWRHDHETLAGSKLTEMQLKLGVNFVAECACKAVVPESLTRYSRGILMTATTYIKLLDHLLLLPRYTHYLTLKWGHQLNAAIMMMLRDMHSI